MANFDIGLYRLYNQGVAGAGFEEPGQVVTHLGAVQAQDYPGALWSLGLRMKQATPALIQQAIAGRTIIRTWPMRGTLHFVAAADVRWLLKLLTPRIISATASRLRYLEIDDKVLGTSKELIVKALEGGKQLTRPEIYQVLERGNISPAGQRGIHIIGRLSQEGLLCFGTHQGKQPTFVLLDEWLPRTRELARDEALAELAKRYFTGHGPATLADFERWAGLKTSDARAGLEMVKAELHREEVAGQTYWLPQNTPPMPGKQPSLYLLPGFDEFILGYKDRSAVFEPQDVSKIIPGGNGMFLPTIVSNGRVVGTWKRDLKKDKIVIKPVPFTALSPAEIDGLVTAAGHYGRFMSTAVELI